MAIVIPLLLLFTLVACGAAPNPPSPVSGPTSVPGSPHTPGGPTATIAAAAPTATVAAPSATDTAAPATFVPAAEGARVPDLSAVTPVPLSPQQLLVNEAMSNALALSSYEGTLVDKTDNCVDVQLERESVARIHASGVYGCKPIDALFFDGKTYSRAAGGAWVEDKSDTPGFKKYYDDRNYLLMTASGMAQQDNQVDTGVEETMHGVKVRRFDLWFAPGDPEMSIFISYWIDPQTRNLHKLSIARAAASKATATTPGAETPTATQELATWTFSRHNETIAVPRP